MIDETIKAAILKGLAEIEAERGVTVLFAAESGSRAWGFASPDSDYDVRFLYRHGRDWYLSVLERRDVIELPIEDDLDVSGWDLRKALRLFLKSNPPLYEWLRSPIVYRAEDGFGAALLDLCKRHYSPRTVAYHYRSIALRQWKAYMRAGGEVRLKKYFYCLRPLLAVGWLEAEGTLPPMMFQDLLAAAALDAPLRDAVDRLLALKAGTSELGTGPRIAALDAWIQERIAASEAFCQEAEVRKPALQAADEFYRNQIGFGPAKG